MEELGFFAAFIAAFAFGTFWFYTACVATFFGIMIMTENEWDGMFPTGLLIGFIVLMQSSAAFDLFADPLALLGWVAVYFVAGTAWASAKWVSFLYKRADEFREYRVAFLMRSIADAPEVVNIPLPVTSKTKVPDIWKAPFNKYLEDEGFLKRRHSRWEHSAVLETITPKIANYKNEAIDWIVWWPTSFLWTMLSDPIVRIAKWIFRNIQGIFQSISNRIFSDLE